MPDLANFLHKKPRDKTKLQFANGFDEYYYVGLFKNPYESLTWLQKNAAKNKKFFLWLPVATLHWPFAFWGNVEEKSMYDPEPYTGIFKDKESILEEMFSIYNNKFYDLVTGQSFDLTKQDKDYIVSKYDYDIYHLDQFIGELSDTIKKFKLNKNTLIVLHGSHGTDLGEHGYFTDYDIYDNEINTILAINNPNNTSKGIKIKKQIRGIDLMPTLLDILGLPIPPKAKGYNLNNFSLDSFPDNLIAFTSRTPPIEVQYLYDFKNIPKNILEIIKKNMEDKMFYPDISIRTNKWKLIHRRFRDFEAKINWWGLISGTSIIRREFELYDNMKDPMNVNNVIDSYPKEAKKLIDELLKWESEHTYPIHIKKSNK